MQNEDFIYNKSFNWFTGVIEDINDPEEMGRYRVRCFGYHTEDKQDIETEQLPWAHVMMPVTSASVSELGTSATGLLQGSWVVGFFRDGSNAQDPLILGSIPSMSVEKPKLGSGFSDPAGQYPVVSKLNTADTPLAAKSINDEYKKSFSYTKKKDLRDNHYNSNSITVAKHHLNDGATGWNFPDIDVVIKPQYPKNHVIAYEKKDDANEASHIVEFDVTPGHERISTIHRTGTYNEITPAGDKTEVIVGSNYKVIANGNNVFIKGGCNLTIEGGCKTRIVGDWDIQVTGNKTEYIGGKLHQETGSTVTETYGGNHSVDVTGSIKKEATESVTENCGGNHVIKASNILLN